MPHETSPGRPFRLARLRTGMLATVALLAAGCGPAKGPPAPPPAEVTVAKPLVKEVTDWDEYTGRLAAVDTVDIRAQVGGYLQSAPFREGALVKKGDVLFVIDPRPYEAVVQEARGQLEQAKYRFELATNDLERAQKSIASGAVSVQDLDTRSKNEKAARAAVTAAEGALQLAELNLDFCRVRAPVGGRVGRKLVTEGNLVLGGAKDATLLTTLVSVDPIQVYFTADEQAYLRYQRLAEKGQRPSSRSTPNPVRMGLMDEDGYPHLGHMDFVDNQVDPGTGTVQGRALFPNPDGLLTPGLFARVRLLGEGPYTALLVPDQAVATDQTQRIVYVVGEGGTLTPKAVRLGRKVGDLRVIRDGLGADDRVVINGLARIRPGMPVAPVDGVIPEPPPEDFASGRETSPRQAAAPKPTRRP